MRIDVVKFLFVGSTRTRSHFFAAAQKTGIVEFIPSDPKTHVQLSKETQQYQEAIKILRHYPPITQEIKRDLHLAKTLVHTILVTKATLDKAEESKLRLEQEIARVQPFGDFSLSQIHALEQTMQRRVRFYEGKTIKHLAKVDEALITINSIDGIDYFIGIKDEPIFHQDLLQVHVRANAQTLKKELHTLEDSILLKINELKELQKYSWLMHYALTHEINASHLGFATEHASALLDDTLFAIEGWVPRNKVQEVEDFTNSMHVMCEEVIIEPNQTIPTYLENKGLPRVGEDLVHVFDTPSHTDKDPSIWILLAFALFFSMIVGDGGYGLIFLITALFCKYKITGMKAVGKRFTTLVVVLGVACVFWGLLMNSFFGVSFPPDSFLGSHSLMNSMVEQKAAYHMQAHDDVYTKWVTQYPELQAASGPKAFIALGNELGTTNNPAAVFQGNVLFELALFVGACHLILGMLRYCKRRPANIGWVLFMVGAYFYAPLYLNATSLINFCFHVPKIRGGEFGLELLCCGAILAVIIALFEQGLKGLLELLTSIQLLSDTLSYLRIYALGLAGAIVAATTNELGGSLPVLLAVVVLILAHGVNIVLSVMGGIIHGLRLNYLEWYHYSFDGGGKKFQPLQLFIHD